MENFCCDLLGKPYIFAQMNLQRFIQKLHTQAHGLEDYIADAKRMETRYTNCQPENREKVAGQRGEFYQEFKTSLASFNHAFSTGYFKKVKVHYPEIAAAMAQFRAKINNNKNLLTLKQLGVL